VTKPERPAGVGEDAILRVFRVPPEAHGMRADVFLKGQLRNTSRTRARAIVERSAYTLLGRRIRPSDRLQAEDRVAIWRPAFEVEDETPPELPTLFEDPHLLVIDKPALLTVHPTARYHQNTVLKRLEQERPGQFLSLIHRLDRETSGILLLAKTPEADRAFKRVIEDRSLKLSTATRHEGELDDDESIDKTYLAITWGTPEEGLIELPLERDEENPLRVKMRVAKKGRGLEAKTRVSVLGSRGGYALLRCELLTGRQHQIRVHLSSAGCPVLGDKLYGPDERMLARAADGELVASDLERLVLPRHALHAHRYRLRHAITRERLDFVAPLAPDLAAFWDGLAQE
jgi:23S rRNA pseudouridine1911/1915/1917 synthase